MYRVSVARSTRSDDGVHIGPLPWTECPTSGTGVDVHHHRCTSTSPPMYIGGTSAGHVESGRAPCAPAPDTATLAMPYRDRTRGSVSGTSECVIALKSSK